MSDEKERNFQKNLAFHQIFYGGIISVGCTLFAIGAALWILVITVLDNLIANGTSIVNLDGINTLILFFVIIGMMLIITGFTAPSLKGWSKKI